MKRFVDCECWHNHVAECPNYVSLEERRAFYASAMSTGTAKTQQAVEGQSPASAVPQADAQNTTGDSA